MDDILDGLPGVLAIADDVIVSGKDQHEHDHNLKLLMLRARQKGLVFNPDKCHINMVEITFFGNIYSAAGVKPGPQKVQAIVDLKAPTKVKELQTLLGMITYLSS
jgi:hypothetical protein